MELKLSQILERFPLRVAITDNCNLDCFFCSNEGMSRSARNTASINPDHFEYLVNLLTNQGLTQISLTGGDPTLHPELDRVLETVNKRNLRSFFHTNGVELGRVLETEALNNFSKIAVSVHALDYQTWHRINRGTPGEYDKLMNSLKSLYDRGMSSKTEVKHVPMRGINDSDETILETLNLCADYGFKFKFLNFEAIEKGQERLMIPINDLTARLRNLGCEPVENAGGFRGQSDYLPIRYFTYKGNPGVAIEIGCGDKSVCTACYKSNEMFLNPNMEFKPCHTVNITIPLEKHIVERNDEAILRAVVGSRKFLYTKPGENSNYWRQEQTA